MPNGLQPVYAKLDRADLHRQDFDNKLDAFLSGDPYRLSFDFNSETRWNTMRWNVHAHPPIDLALIFGDMLTNLRSSLDYLVWQLILQNSETPTRRSAFPVLTKAGDDDEHWRSACDDQLRGIDEVWLATIRELQPFNRAERPDWHPLAVLNEVNNANKHRTTPPVITTAESVAFKGPLNPGQYEHEAFVDEPIRDGAPHFRWRNLDPHAVDPVPLRITSDPRFRVAFSDGVGLNWTNLQLCTEVRLMVKRFEPAFDE